MGVIFSKKNKRREINFSLLPVLYK
jgi:hypothetical protein